MSLMPATDEFRTGFDTPAIDMSHASMALDETYWGYIIRDMRRSDSMLVAMQLAAGAMAAAFAVATIGLWAMPSMAFTGAAIMSKAILSAFFLGMAGVLAWYATRGCRSELQVDLRLGEVREVVRNRAGRATLIGRYGFDSIGGAFLDNAKSAKGTATLKIRYRNTTRTIEVARGPLARIEALRDRLGRDLLADPMNARKREPLPEPKFAF